MSMQPIYLTGHFRPVRKVQFNFDGDLLFTCSDDQTVCMYNTFLLERIGIFQINDSCKCIDVSRDSKLLLATATTIGVKMFDTTNGDQLAEIPVNSMVSKFVELSYSDKQFLIVSEDRQADDIIKIFNTKDALAWGVKKDEGQKQFPAPVMEIRSPKDHKINCVKWGPLDKSIYYCTDKGRLIKYNLEKKCVELTVDKHKGEIFSVELTDDFTMLLTCGNDGFCKLLNPETFDEIRKFNHEFPCRGASVSPLYMAEENQKFHVLICGGQDAKDVTTTAAQKGGFEMKLFNIIHNEQLAVIKGHFGTVHSVAFHPDGISFASGSEDGYVHYHRMLPEYFTKKFE